MSTKYLGFADEGGGSASVEGIVSSGEGLDCNTSDLTFTRLPFRAEVKSSHYAVINIKIEIVICQRTFAPLRLPHPPRLLPGHRIEVMQSRSGRFWPSGSAMKELMHQMAKR